MNLGARKIEKTKGQRAKGPENREELRKIKGHGMANE
jgi:hypothetical protein